ncbi:MAG: hypothetical protein HXY43_14350 [Fischerella sp.]|uniref:hypothetical protein n=1 Tax=unclassified Fischerella TaxID=494603 RepID=UPI0012DC6C08|nr:MULTISPECIES: hypothetical protein [unclassified Fischerella]NWF60402.1 hypothetical protein [Fischerella sp.]
MNFAKIDGLAATVGDGSPDTETRGHKDAGKISKQFTASPRLTVSASACSKKPQLGIVEARNGSRVCF